MSQLRFIATLCFNGYDEKSAAMNAERLEILEHVSQELSQTQNTAPEAVVFPGGFLFLEQHIGPLSFTERKAIIERSPIGLAAATFTQKNPGTTLVLGIDSAVSDDGYGGDQLAVAFSQKGVEAIGRKAFPVDEDIDGKAMPPMVFHEDDYNVRYRSLALPGGTKAVLCACYDVFGVGDAIRGRAQRLSKAKLFRTNGTDMAHPFTAQNKRAMFEKWRRSMEDTNPDIALGCIHRFQKSGRDNFWQRHGIANAAAGLKGCFAAAHYRETLPGKPGFNSLCSTDVPKEHLEAGSYRKAHSLTPTHHATIGDKALIRFFPL